MKKLITITGMCMALVASASADPKGGSEEGKGEDPCGPCKAGGPGGKRPSPEQLVQKLDTSGDGVVSLEEYKAGRMAKKAKDPSKVEKRFAMIDADEDGNASKEEFAAAFKKMAERRGKARAEGGKGKRKGKPDSAE